MTLDTVSMLLQQKKSQITTTVAPTMTVSAAVQTMNTAKIGAAMVLEQQRLIGIFTERDLMVRVVGEGRDPERTPVSEVMTSSVSTVTSGTSIGEAMRMMSERRYRHLPVVDGELVCGLISMGDVTHWTIQSQQDAVNMALGAVKRMGFSNRRG